MGLAASQGRFLALTARKSDIEFQGQLVNQERMTLAHQSEALFQAIVNLTDPNSTEYQAAELQLENYHDQDRVLEINLKNLDSQQQAVQTEIEAVQKVIDKNIEQTFKTFA